MMNTHINDLQEQLARVCAERDALKEALDPFAEAFDMAAGRIKTGSLSEIVALAKHYVPASPFHRAFILLKRDGLGDSQ